MITPIKKPIGRDLAETQKDFNRQINSIRSATERGNAHLKTWKILDTDYRRPLHTLPTTLRLYFYTPPRIKPHGQPAE